MSTEGNHWVDEHPSPLRIAIVGAGIGGLSAAISLRRQGHIVNLYEQSRFASETGAAVHLAPNANGILRRWGINAEDFGGTVTNRIVEYFHDGGLKMNIDLSMANRQWQHPWHLVYRVSFHDALKKMAMSEDGAGTPATLHTSAKVVDIDPDKGIMTLANGQTIEADVIVGADGIYSTTRKYIQDAQLFSSGKAAFRFMMPLEVATADPVTAPVVQFSNALTMWYGNDRRVVMYPCNNGLMLNFVCIHPDNLSHATKGDEWSKDGDIEQLLKVYKDFDPALLTLFRKMDPSSLKVWQLLDMEKLPSWTTGKLVLLGDAAHPFTPHQGQGAGQAIEDAAALGTVLPKGTAPSAVLERLKLYEKIRYERAHAIQEYSRLAGQDWVDGKPPLDVFRYTNYNFGHDELDNAAHAFKRWKLAQNKSVYQRMPLGFGPTPRPRQDMYGRQLPDGPSRTFTTASIEFKTSRTLLQNLFPADQFRFTSAATVASASLRITTIENTAWLGGKGYTHLGLYIHGVQYVKKDGSLVAGSYLPVLFENLTDPILSGREELGYPKLFADLEVQRTSDAYEVTASWRGSVFVKVRLHGLVSEPISSRPDPALSEQGPDTLTYRYIPSVGEPGKSDAEYAVVTPLAEENKIQSASIRSSAQAKEASIQWSAGDWTTLPTLHHITSALSEIPVYEILGAKVVEGSGLSDVRSARRIE